jgi:hypothetical protein
MEITERGHLWTTVSYKGKEYMLSYNYGLDITLIMNITEEDYQYVNYFHGGYDPMTETPQDTLLKDAQWYLDNL